MLIFSETGSLFHLPIRLMQLFSGRSYDFTSLIHHISLYFQIRCVLIFILALFDFRVDEILSCFLLANSSCPNYLTKKHIVRGIICDELYSIIGIMSLNCLQGRLYQFMLKRIWSTKRIRWRSYGRKVLFPYNRCCQ